MIVRTPWYPPVDAELQTALGSEGLSLMGVAAPQEDREAESQYRRWIREGHHGSMDYLERHGEIKYHPDRLVPGVRSIVFVGLNYYQKAPSGWGRGEARSPVGRVARYAWGRDYHKELGKRLRRVSRVLGDRYPDDTFRSWTDATPLAERHYAERAGIGFTGRNTLVISGQFGSWFVLGEILTTREYTVTGPVNHKHGACPRTCARCIDVCPTGALYAPHRIDASRCISYLTIEYDGVIPEALRPAMGDWIFGCDLCQEVCPLNVRAQATTVAGFVKPIAGATVDLRQILQISDDREFTDRFAGSPLMRAKRRRLVRNACIAAANLGADHLLDELVRLSRDDDQIVAVHARWAVEQLRRR